MSEIEENAKRRAERKAARRQAIQEWAENWATAGFPVTPEERAIYMSGFDDGWKKRDATLEADRSTSAAEKQRLVMLAQALIRRVSVIQIFCECGHPHDYLVGRCRHVRDCRCQADTGMKEMHALQDAIESIDPATPPDARERDGAESC